MLEEILFFLTIIILSQPIKKSLIMFIGHLPAGYLVTSLFLNNSKSKLSNQIYDRIWWIGIISSVLPDFDLIYFYLIDNRQHLHHLYWTHIPFYWIFIFSFFKIVSYLLKNNLMNLINWIIAINIFLHLFLDTLVGKILWLYPFSNNDIVFFEVSAQYSWWVLNFILHWTFFGEIILIVIAFYTYRMKRRKIR